jgi:3-hydroxybutyryl-CoA dehydratase
MIKGDKFTRTFVVTDKIYHGFIELFNDNNPLHTSAEFAAGKGFSGRVMHGNILGGFLSYFIGECLPVKNVIIHSQEIKYMNPVYMNDQLSFNAEISEVFESVKAVEFKFLFSKEDSVKVAKGKIQIGII